MTQTGIDTRTVDDLMREIASLKAELEEIRTADQGYRDLLVTVGHELRSPLNALGLHLGYLERLSLRAKDPELTGQIKRVERILRGYVNKIHALLDMARISAGVYALKPERVILADVIADVIELYDAKAEYQGVTVGLDLEPGLAGQWDRAAIETIVSNLVSNALKFAPGAPVVIETRSDGLGNAIVRIVDQGPGVDEGRRGQIFEKFARAIGPERTVGGFGIGLWIARHLATLHGGTIAVDSTSDVGATFIVRLPIALYVCATER